MRKFLPFMRQFSCNAKVFSVNIFEKMLRRKFSAEILNFGNGFENIQVSNIMKSIVYMIMVNCVTLTVETR